jgi:HD-like signal output (HDOD) protein
VDPAILRCIDERNAIPSAPHIVTRLYEIATDPSCTADRVARLLATDAGVVTDLLRLANSALFGGARRVLSVAEAVVRLGTLQVRSLVVSRALVQLLHDDARCLIDRTDFWRRSLATAALAARFASHHAHVARELGFTAGLLSDVGVLILCRALPEEYAPLAELYATLRGEELRKRERDVLGVAHAEVGALALERWRLPEALIAAVRERSPGPAPLTAALSGLLDGAHELARALCERQPSGCLRELCSWALERADVSPSALAGMLPQIEADIADLAATLRIEVLQRGASANLIATLAVPWVAAPAQPCAASR